ncbi:LLM class flavin-dependent oxidoreductase [Geodermatophilus sp. SYSU D01105]
MPTTEFYLRSYPLPDDVRACAAAAEDDGWDGLLLTDTQNLSMDVVGSLHLAAAATSRLRLGTAVTNLVTRHPAVVASTFATLHHVTGGRAHLGVGRGDTALALIGLRAPSAQEFEQQLGRLRTWLRGGTVEVDGLGSRITWLPVAGEEEVPVDVFGSGPHVIAAAARQADRVTVTVGAETTRVEWAVRTAREARAAAGLDPQTLDVGAFVVVGVGTDQAALDELVRGNASISAHFQRGSRASLSTADATVVADVSAHYDTYHHGLEHATQAKALSGDFLRRFCVIGGPDECVRRLRELVGLGLSHVTVVGGSRDIDPGVRERSDRLVATEVLPALRSP